MLSQDFSEDYKRPNDDDDDDPTHDRHYGVGWPQLRSRLPPTVSPYVDSI